ncbi:IS66 family insertion sequence element accessory protein TnpB [Bradyrhizobium sp. SEMIA]|uniref:IS66 family insertion sequence element accessory protein TnpB n=1 Tax=Bradyrhizobium sp. SEMIA TaxID=2597515 RepID=UPI00223EE400|nr:IS66 family insertion sequence element accessory protein TnpB [Bradyrhizobium sp. SEMIA]
MPRRHGLSPQQLFGWRRQLREAAGGHFEADEGQFVPAVVDAVVPTPALGRERKEVLCKARPDTGIIEIEVAGISRGAYPTTIASIVQALKASGDRAVGCGLVMVASKPVDFRKGMDGLATLMHESMGANPFSGAVYMFQPKRADRIKLVFWDGTGLCLFAKRLEDGIFRWPKIEDGVMRLSSARLSALLERLDWRLVHEARETPR